MREIKFRAWDKTYKDWVYFVVPESFGDGITYTHYEHWCEYTGLKDKNGRETYEGDVLEALVFGTKTGYRGVVKYELGQFLVDYTDTGNRICTLRDRVGFGKDFIDQDEVIGNIWENGELLK